ncbi:MAG: sensor histidine kinase KdpD [Rhizobium sp.]|nr:sensor histidine kinase KdpD [Rhizobium sp.]
MNKRKTDADLRPDPEALLALAGKGRRGRLTIFLGAAPGVGKTFAMLTRARRLRVEGQDILIGLVETHGRPETAELLDGLETLPCRRIDYHGRMIEEFDLDAALARRPAIIVVDELAHTNPPECRHPKRFQDVEELLDNGIDVWTAVNVQHLESLSDVVSQFAGVPVREVVPDHVLNDADDVILIDIPPAELIERLEQGKVYLPDNAKRARDKFFRLGNLTALREMALRRTADRVDDQMIDYLRQNAIEGPWRTAERLVVCVAADPVSEEVIRAAGRMAQSLNAPWTAVHVERPDRPTSTTTLQQLDDNFRLAERLGAETKRLVGSDFVDEILKFARKEHATQIVMGVIQSRPIVRFWQPSLVETLIRNGEGISVHVVNTSDRKQVATRRPRALPNWRALVPEVAVSVVSVLVATVAAIGLSSILPLPNVSLLFLLAVVVAAIREGYRAAIIAAALSALVYNVSFIEPVGTLTIAAPHEVFAFFVFIAAAIAAGGIASRVREQRAVALERARITEALYDLSSKLSAVSRGEDAVWAAATQLNGLLKRQIVFYLPNDGELELAASWPPDETPEVIDIAAARWAFDKDEAAGAGTGTLPSSAYQFRPLQSPAGVIGVCGFRFEARPLDSGEVRIFEATLHQTAITIDRARLSRTAMEQAATLAGDRFRSALLSSISHDLKTPLATITGAASSLREFGDRLSAETRSDLLVSIEEEAERLSRFVGNLLDMTGIESGTLEPRSEWTDLKEVIHQAVDRTQKLFGDAKIETSLASDLPLIKGDSVLLGQVLFNLLDNAVKYGGGEPISIYARRNDKEAVVSVTDLGRGIPERDLSRVFDKFVRGSRKSDGRTPGTGLGLAIARGFVEAMGGRIAVESPALKKRGTRFILRFPVPEQADVKERQE